MIALYVIADDLTPAFEQLQRETQDTMTAASRAQLLQEL